MTSRPTITLITPTADQPTGLALAERYVARQTMPPDQWLVADDGTVTATLTLGQTHLKRHRAGEGAVSLAGNLLAAIPHATGDIIVIWEHDDWYPADYLATCVASLSRPGVWITGTRRQRYYHLPSRRSIIMRNVGSALCNTALRAEALPILALAASSAARGGSYGIDRRLWTRIPDNRQHLHDEPGVVGIKGLPGRPGLGMGHRPDAATKRKRHWQADPAGATLRDWVGEADAAAYQAIVEGRT